VKRKKLIKNYFKNYRKKIRLNATKIITTEEKKRRKINVILSDLELMLLREVTKINITKIQIYEISK